MSTLTPRPFIAAAVVAWLLAGCGGSNVPSATGIATGSATVTLHVHEMGERLELM